MKRKLLLILPMFLFTLASNAQHTWLFSDTSIWPASGFAGYSVTTTVDGLDIVPGSGTTNMGLMATSSPALTFSDSFVGTVYSATGGAASPTGFLPTKRYYSFPITAGAGTVKVWFSAGSSAKTVWVSDGVRLLGSQKMGGTSKVPFICTATYTALDARTIYVYSDSVFIYKIEWAPDVATPLATDSFKADSSVAVYANGNQVFVSNVKSNTTVAVYSVAGALVKTIETSSDTSFDLGSGVYVAKVKSAEGEKSVKLLVK